VEAKKVEETTFRPFHETICEAIRGCGSNEEFIHLLELIQKTKIPSGFDEIIKSIDDNFYARFMSRESSRITKKVQATKESILKQKEAALSRKILENQSTEENSLPNLKK